MHPALGERAGERLGPGAGGRRTGTRIAYDRDSTHRRRLGGHRDVLLRSWHLRYVLSILIPVAAIAATLAVARWLPRWTGLQRAEQGLFAAARKLHSERRIALSGDLSALGSSTLVAAIAAAGCIGLALAGRLRDGVVLALVAALAGASGTWLKRVTRRERPAGSEGATFGSSFPSSHTLMGTATWLTLAGIAASVVGPAGAAPLQAWIWAVAAAVAVCVGVSRVFLHAHYLSDVVAGWVIGAALAVAGAVWRTG